MPLQIKYNSLLGGALSFFFTSVPIFVTLATFIMYSALGNKLTAATAFTSLSLFQIIRFPLLIVPMIITRLIDLSVVNKRLSRFLNAPQRETRESHPSLPSLTIIPHFHPSYTIPHSHPSLPSLTPHCLRAPSRTHPAHSTFEGRRALCMRIGRLLPTPQHLSRLPN